MADNEEQFTTWCAGLPLVGRRAFTEDERRQIQTRYIWCSRVAWFSTAFLAAQFFMLPAIQEQIMVDGLIGVVATFDMVFLVLSGFGMLAHLPRHHFGRALRSSELLTFEGVVPDVPLNLTERDLLGTRGSRARLELPSGATRPWTINGERPAWLQSVPALKLVRVAPVPYGDPATRPLIAEEEEELDLYVKGLSQRHLGEIVPLILMWPFAALQLATERLSSPPTLVLFAVMMTIVYLLTGRDTYIAVRRLRHALARKRLTLDGGDPNVILLEGSDITWIVQGRPAAWRTFACSQVLPFAVEKKRKPIVISAKPQ